MQLSLERQRERDKKTLREKLKHYEGRHRKLSFLALITAWLPANSSEEKLTLYACSGLLYLVR